MSPYAIDIFWSEEDAGFIAEAPALPGCSAWGASEADAAREVQDAVAAWVQAAEAAGKVNPAPRVVQPIETYSGKFPVRVPRSLHARLARRAAQEGVSLNQFLTGVLASEVVSRRQADASDLALRRLRPGNQPAHPPEQTLFEV